MNIGTKYEYLWQDPVEYPTPTNLCAKDYIDKMLTWVENLLNDEKIFPTLVEQSFPDDFITVVGNIFRRLFRAYGHIYSKYILLLSFYILLFFYYFIILVIIIILLMKIYHLIITHVLKDLYYFQESLI